MKITRKEMEKKVFDIWDEVNKKAGRDLSLGEFLGTIEFVSGSDKKIILKK